MIKKKKAKPARSTKRKKVSGVKKHTDVKSHNAKFNIKISGLNELAKEREVLFERINNMESAIKHLRGSVKLYPPTAHKHRADILYYKERIRICKAELKSVNKLIQKELKRK